jgi:hypothetical protein
MPPLTRSNKSTMTLYYIDGTLMQNVIGNTLVTRNYSNIMAEDEHKADENSATGSRK